MAFSESYNKIIFHLGQDDEIAVIELYMSDQSNWKYKKYYD